MDSTAAFRVIEIWIRPNAGLYLFLSPLVHSYHQHIAENAVTLLISGILTEKQIGSWRTLLLVYSVGVISNIVPPLLGYGGFGVGISGAFYCLWAFVGITYTIDWLDELHKEQRSHKKLIGYPLVWFAGLLYLVTSILQFFGLASAAQGAATGAHFTGVVFGLALVVIRAFAPATWQNWTPGRRSRP